VTLEDNIETTVAAMNPIEALESIDIASVDEILLTASPEIEEVRITDNQKIKSLLSILQKVSGHEVNQMSTGLTFNLVIINGNMNVTININENNLSIDDIIFCIYDTTDEEFKNSLLDILTENGCIVPLNEYIDVDANNIKEIQFSIIPGKCIKAFTEEDEIKEYISKLFEVKVYKDMVQNEQVFGTTCIDIILKDDSKVSIETSGLDITINGDKKVIAFDTFVESDEYVGNIMLDLVDMM